MSMSEPLLTQIVNQHIPAGATVVTIDKPVQHPAIYAADLTGDGMPEIAAVYQLNGEPVFAHSEICSRTLDQDGTN